MQFDLQKIREKNRTNRNGLLQNMEARKQIAEEKAVPEKFNSEDNIPFSLAIVSNNVAVYVDPGDDICLMNIRTKEFFDKDIVSEKYHELMDSIINHGQEFEFGESFIMTYYKYFKKEESFLSGKYVKEDECMEVKTLEGWGNFTNETGKSSWGDYAKPGDLVDEKTADYFLNIMPPASMNHGYFQVGEPYEHLLDEETGSYKAVFPTFLRVNEGTWRWCGNCFKGKTEEPKKETEIQQENVFPKRLRGRAL